MLLLPEIVLLYDIPPLTILISRFVPFPPEKPLILYAYPFVNPLSVGIPITANMGVLEK